MGVAIYLGCLGYYNLDVIDHYFSPCILLQPKRAHWILKIIWFVQWPFSLLRWLTVPSFGYVSSNISQVSPLNNTG